MSVALVQRFFRFESSAAILLLASAVLALVAENTALAPLYNQLLELSAGVHVGAFELRKPLLLWINDGLMAVFFLLVGLELKREFCDGELSTPAQAVLPFVAAVGGMIVPAMVYYFIAHEDPTAGRGWAISTATDIAFSLGVLGLLGSRAPRTLKVFLTALAIFDDLGAILVIAFFYTSSLSAISLSLAALGIFGLFVLNRMAVGRLAAYILVGVFVWICVLKSGVHATLAGVVVALAIPYKLVSGESPLKHLEHALHPWVAYGVLPLFGFANAGVSFSGLGVGDLVSPIALGVAAGLVVGKMVGIFGSSALAIMVGLGKLPAGVSWLQLLGVSAIAGIGFTMSLFIGSLAFDQLEQIVSARIGILLGSLVAGVIGVAILFAGGRNDERQA